MNVLVTGSLGQLGSEILALSGRDGNKRYYFYDLPELDITDKKAVEHVCGNHDIDAIVNCAAYTAVDNAEDNSVSAYRVNRDGAAVLAEVAKDRDALLVHISTDYVFDGKAYKPYREHDPVSPLGVYGKSKWEGEELVRQIAPSYMIIRTSWLYSSYGNNFARTMLRLGDERELLKVVFDQVGTPTLAADLAGAIMAILDRYGRGDAYAEVYHYSNEGICSWYDFAKAIMKIKNLKCKVLPVESKEYPTKARRPHYSVLHKGKIRQEWGLDIPHWYDSLEKMLAGC